ncbi:hypothetical protein LCGC14_0275960 [marine sediment metagenome]|uniref:Uncharacterized protein n=1 Tax=marine sediment metagenome TaxID=412755 RepID=A0A0F9U2M5_9ZZZZ
MQESRSEQGEIIVKVNLKSFSIKRRVQQDGRVSLAFRVSFTDSDHDISPMLHCTQHIDEFCMRLRGIMGFWAAHAFEDGLYYLLPSPTGIRFLVSAGSLFKRVKSPVEPGESDDPFDILRGYRYVDEQVLRGFETVQLTFPGDELADLIDKTRLSYKVRDLAKGVSAEIDEVAAARLRYKYREVAKIIFRNDETKERFIKALHGPHAESFRDCVQATYRGTRNMSMGNVMHLEVHSDGASSFMFIRRNMEKLDEYGRGAYCGNGGWINHHNADGSSAGFSTHT